MTVEKDLEYSRIDRSARQWLEYSGLACAAAVVLPLAAGQLLLAPVAGALAFAAVYKYPWYRRKRIAGDVERELPLTLRSIASSLAIGLPFEEALRHGGNGELGRQLKRVLRDVNLGASVPEALEEMAERVDSQQLAKAVAQLSAVYNGLGGPQSLKKQSDELVAIQRSALKEYSGKLAVYSLMFIALSAIVPALFQAYVLVGSTFMAQGLSPSDAFAISVVAFPAVDLGMLVFIRLKKPFFA